MNKPFHFSPFSPSSMGRGLFFSFLTIVWLSVMVMYSPLWAEGLPDDGAIHIAVVGPFTGKTAVKGQSIKRGVELYVDAYNEARLENQKTIVLDYYDDQNTPQLAKQMAEQIVRDNRAVAVIGHNYSSSSKSGGPVYQANKIPAISPTSTDVAVTKDNDWYFRAVFNDQLQGRFLANYAKTILETDTVSIISEDLAYGRLLADNFEQAAKSLKLAVRYRGEIVVGDENLETTMDAIIQDLRGKEESGVIFLATHAPEGVEIIRKLRDADITTPIITPDSFASKSFRDGFNHLPKEMSRPGHYTNGIYVATPLIFDTGNEKAQIFREHFSEIYQEEPDWIAAYAYDSTMLMVQAILNNHVQGVAESRIQDRQAIRDYLAGMDRPDTGLEGVTGLNFFDEQGDAQKSISIGKFQNRNLISAATQLQTIKNLDEIDEVDEAAKEGRVILIENNHMHRVKVVFVGFHINKVEKLDLQALTFDMDFQLWFRYQGALDMDEIVFLNATAPIAMGQPVEEVVSKKSNYRRYHLTGTFRADFLEGKHNLRRHVLGLNFRYNKLPRTNLVFVNDVLGMKLDGKENLTDILNKNKVLGPNSGWLVSDVHVFQDTVVKDSFGSPAFLNSQKEVDYSRFNIAFAIQKDEMSLRGLFDAETSVILLCGSVVVLIFSLFRRKIAVLKPWHRSFWFLITLAISILLLASEVVLIEWLADKTTPNNLAMVVLAFDIFWWLAVALVLNMATEHFLWLPMERKTGQIIPKIIRRFLSYIIFILAVFGIIAFVFDQRLTSLLATSGMIAMIVGLAIQANISNIFSGIAINVERPFRIGDWVKVGSLEAGRVDDITWRTTQLWNRDGSVTRVPNAKMAESIIQNFSGPHNAASTWLFIDLDPKHSPAEVEIILHKSLLSVPEVLKNPPPFASYRGVENWAANYMLGFNIKDYGQLLPIRKKVTKKIWADLRLAGIEFATKRWNVIGREDTFDIECPFSPVSVLNDLVLFDDLPKETKEAVEKGTIEQRYTAGQTILTSGEACVSMVVIVEGVGGIHARLGDVEVTEIRRIGAGECFVEEALLKDGQQEAEIVALTDARVIHLTKEDLLHVFERSPQQRSRWTKIMADHTASIAEGRGMLEKKQAAKGTNQSSGLFQGMKKWFSS